MNLKNEFLSAHKAADAALGRAQRPRASGGAATRCDRRTFAARGVPGRLIRRRCCDYARVARVSKSAPTSLSACQGGCDAPKACRHRATFANSKVRDRRLPRQLIHKKLVPSLLPLQPGEAHPFVQMSVQAALRSPGAATAASGSVKTCGHSPNSSRPCKASDSNGDNNSEPRCALPHDPAWAEPLPRLRLHCPLGGLRARERLRLRLRARRRPVAGVRMPERAARSAHAPAPRAQRGAGASSTARRKAGVPRASGRGARARVWAGCAARSSGLAHWLARG